MSAESGFKLKVDFTHRLLRLVALSGLAGSLV